MSVISLATTYAFIGSPLFIITDLASSDCFLTPPAPVAYKVLSFNEGADGPELAEFPDAPPPI